MTNLIFGEESKFHRFYIPPCEAKSAVKANIERFGGIVVANLKDAQLALLPDKSQPLEMTDNCVPYCGIRWVARCTDTNTNKLLLNIEDYPPDFVGPTKSPNKPGNPGNGRAQYSVEDNEQMVKWFKENTEFHTHPHSSTVWKLARKTGAIISHSWQSLKNHWKVDLYPHYCNNTVDDYLEALRIANSQPRKRRAKSPKKQQLLKQNSSNADTDMAQWMDTDEIEEPEGQQEASASVPTCENADRDSSPLLRLLVESPKVMHSPPEQSRQSPVYESPRESLQRTGPPIGCWTVNGEREYLISVKEPCLVGVSENEKLAAQKNILVLETSLEKDEGVNYPLGGAYDSLEALGYHPVGKRPCDVIDYSVMVKRASKVVK
eukprot:Platyproteum_vivax@DN6890_c0_g1_i1.p1